MKLRTIALIGIAALAAANAAEAQVTIRTQRQPQSWLGFSYSTQVVVLDGQRRDLNVVLDVVESSPAARGGLQAGDTLVRVNNLVATEALLSSLRYAIAPGDEVQLRVKRSGSERSLTVRAAERPADMVALGPDSRLMVIDRDSLLGRITDLLDATRAHLDEVRIPEIIIRGRGGNRGLQIFSDTLFRLWSDSTFQNQIRLPDSLFLRLDTLHRFFPFANMRFDTIMRLWSDTAWNQIFRSNGPNFVFGNGDDDLLITGGTGITMLGYRAIAGAQLGELEPELAEYFDVDDGILVMRVPDNTPAYRAGLRTGDVIVGADGSTIESIAELRRIMSRGPRTQPVRLDVIRKGTRRTIDLARD